MKAKNFKDDPKLKDKDNDRRLVLPSSKLSNDAAEALEKHIHETRTGKTSIISVDDDEHLQEFNLGTRLSAIFTLSHSMTLPLPLGRCRCKY